MNYFYCNLSILKTKYNPSLHTGHDTFVYQRILTKFQFSMMICFYWYQIFINMYISGYYIV